MPQPLTKNLKINEIFFSLQGEGLRQGESTLFVRLSGCNLECDFCDTKYAWEEGRDMTVDLIHKRVLAMRSRHPSRWVCLTGGEPLLQNIKPLIKKLRIDGFKIQVETNGSLYKNLPVDWYTVSPKPEKYFYNPKYRDKAREVKLVVTKNLEMGTVIKIRKEFPEKTPLLLQVQSNLKWSLRRGLKLLEQAETERIKNIRLAVQLHKILGFP
ncbi:MAG: 7-carboxy-7-deazaguanine synthase QueE [Candidatus Aminicenantes bacterium]|jgi:organic radical activating enzyme